MSDGRPDKRQNRQWVKVQLGDDDESRYVGEIVTYWKNIRQATRLIRRAIVVYYGLKNGNTEALYQDFPELRFSTLPPSPAPKAPAATIKRQAIQKSSDEDKDDLLGSLGL